MDLVVRVDDHDGWRVVRLHGDLDLATALALREQVIRVLTSGPPRVILDLEGVDFIDSTGLGVIVGLLKRARGLGGDLRLVCTRQAIHDLFELTSLDTALPLSATVDAAAARQPTSGG
jgi:anti-sigma B factor antagonist